MSPVLNFTNTGQQLQLLWPQDHTGWRLQMNTNLAGTNWVEIPATSTNQIGIPMNVTNGSVFFRLIYP